MKYQKRICCFIDILGFKKHIDETVNDNGEENIKKIESIKHILKLTKKITNDLGFSKSKVITYFSDSIVISYKYDEPSQLFYTILDLLYVSFELANKGYLTRGGVSVGKLVHSSKYIFGPALVEAYDLESKKAKFPRIIVSEEVIKIGVTHRKDFHSEKDESEYLMNILTLDDDGYYFIDYITKASSEFDDLEYDLFYYIQNIKKSFFTNYKNETLDVKEKLDWLKIKLNNHIKQIQENVKNPVFDSEIRDLYSSLTNVK
ncbi:hypothetical protein SAMN05444143_1391 [Flavobacterium succinicans]|uniref:Guanylate cyclase domain-containing protein n=1 Tax=Flavobacterium succinicans TaxID=29536 RepID=A0A1I5AFH1_9FLAO|nr:hypothetical protein [Flavobacterium succinicans]SFN61120.1 hypothetical protein SAMN05444143_1391 [Flavobacterium succinicans]